MIHDKDAAALRASLIQISKIEFNIVTKNKVHCSWKGWAWLRESRMQIQEWKITAHIVISVREEKVMEKWN